MAYERFEATKGHTYSYASHTRTNVYTCFYTCTNPYRCTYIHSCKHKLIISFLCVFVCDYVYKWMHLRICVSRSLETLNYQKEIRKERNPSSKQYYILSVRSAIHHARGEGAWSQLMKLIVVIIIYVREPISLSDRNSRGLLSNCVISDKLC